MARTLTAADAVIMLTIPGLFSTPQQLQGFGADAVYEIGNQDQTETMPGVDGILSAGYIYAPVDQTFTLQADSLSNDIFEAWSAQQQQQKTVFRCSGQTILLATGKAYVSNNGALISMPPMPGAGKLLQARKYLIRWQSVQAQPA